ncbi:MAG: rRNA maturation RNase YbeY [Caulobacteraceae bacterium]|nr:rRNA maturation RNase YbeY [Caulobacteraceae bacterium]
MPVAIEVEIEAEGWNSDGLAAEALAQAAGEAALAVAEWTGGVVVLLTDDATVADLNSRFRGKDGPTNVLSFPAPDNPEAHLGDIALALGVCQREAQAQGKPLGHHLQHLVAHGVLHLVGYDHLTDSEAETMEALERRILAGLGVPDPYAAERDADHV